MLHGQLFDIYSVNASTEDSSKLSVSNICSISDSSKPQTNSLVTSGAAQVPGLTNQSQCTKLISLTLF